jgi:hypothetical protein
MWAEAMTKISSRFVYGAAWVIGPAGEAPADRYDHRAQGLRLSS